MKSVKDVAEITGLSIRTLRYYDEIGLLKPTQLTEAGYRLYDNKALETLQEIMFFKEMKIPLVDIKKIMENPDYDKEQALLTHKKFLISKRNRLNGIIELIDDVMKGVNTMSFEAFNDEDINKILDHALKPLGDDSVRAIVEEYGSVEAFREKYVEHMKDEKICTHYIKLFGSKEKMLETSLKEPLDQESLNKLKNESVEITEQFVKAKESGNENITMDAVAKLADNTKRFMRMDNARYLLLKIADHYLHPHGDTTAIEAMEKKYGTGITEYIGSAIKRYYGA